MSCVIEGAEVMRRVPGCCGGNLVASGMDNSTWAGGLKLSVAVGSGQQHLSTQLAVGSMQLQWRWSLGGGTSSFASGSPGGTAKKGLAPAAPAPGQ